jgi:hypothetical protein
MLRGRRGRCLAFTILILINTPIHAEWVALDARRQSHPLQTVYIDPDTVRREGHFITLSTMIDWKAMQGGRSPTRFYSTIVTKQFDCANKLARTLAATDYDQHMGVGEVIGGGVPTSEGHWAVIEPGTLNQRLWETVCGKE